MKNTANSLITAIASLFLSVVAMVYIGNGELGICERLMFSLVATISFVCFLIFIIQTLGEFYDKETAKAIQKEKNDNR